MKATTLGTVTHNKNLTRIVLGTVLLLLIPLVAMQFSDEVAWSVADFAVVGALLLGTGFSYELIASKLRNAKSRTIVGVTLAVAFVLIWIELAVGIFGTPFSGS